MIAVRAVQKIIVGEAEAAVECLAKPRSFAYQWPDNVEMYMHLIRL